MSRITITKRESRATLFSRLFRRSLVSADESVELDPRRRLVGGLFGCAKPLLWQGLSVEPHAGLGDYQGIFVAARSTGCHISLPTWADSALRESLSRQGISHLCEPGLWHQHPATARLSMLGPSVHSYTDKDPGGQPHDVATADDLTDFKIAVGEADWNEGGFANDILKVFVIRDISVAIVAAANLTEFLGQPADVGVVVHPDHRGQGLGARVGRAAASYAVRECGIARWRALTSNSPSRNVAATLGFEPYCQQLAVR